ncbi:unnamed protein product [Camellia sinensis]
MESTDSSSGSQHLHLPPGFRFHPTDEELVVHYLKKKASLAPLPVTIIAEIDLYKFDPWELPSKATFGEQEWYFFSPRDRKYPNGARPNRAATSGYWKATGTDKPILTSNGTQKVGVKKALVFYGGKPPKGIKTNWIMHEYRLIDNNSGTFKPPGSDPTTKKVSLRLDDWVLCRIYKKNNSSRPTEEREDHMLVSNSTILDGHNSNPKLAASRPSNYGALLEHEENFFQGILNNGVGMQNSEISQLASPNTKPDVSMASTSPPMKRTVPTQYWNNEPALKRFHGDQHENTSTGVLEGNNGSSFVSLLNHQLVPQSGGGGSFQPNTLDVGSLGDGVLSQHFHLPSMNWNL